MKKKQPGGRLRSSHPLKKVLQLTGLYHNFPKMYRGSGIDQDFELVTNKISKTKVTEVFFF